MPGEAVIYTTREMIPLNITKINTMHLPSPGYRDDAERIRCSACGNLFDLATPCYSAARGTYVDAVPQALTEAHLRS